MLVGETNNKPTGEVKHNTVKFKVRQPHVQCRRISRMRQSRATGMEDGFTRSGRRHRKDILKR